MNVWNTQEIKRNSTRNPGVVCHKTSGRYQARMYVNGRRVSLGYYDTAAEAGRVYARRRAEEQATILRVSA
jgi:hypothetical protein